MTSVEPGRRERKKEETRRRILERSMDLFEEKGFDNVTMEEIAEAADVAKGTLYNYFPVKEAILSSYVQKYARELKPEVDVIIESQPDTRSRLVAFLRFHARWVEDRKDLMEKYISYRITFPLRSMRDTPSRSGFDQHTSRILSLGQDAGDIRQDLDARALSACLLSFYTWAYFGWLSLPEAFDLDRIIEQTVDLFLDGATAKRRGGGT
ncbi:MAG: TetR/AcrR family transcriptional regulator [bacterium]|nr:MAG: TetR/AcrR family transcriptional regulator [bacterium]